MLGKLLERSVVSSGSRILNCPPFYSFTVVVVSLYSYGYYSDSLEIMYTTVMFAKILLIVGFIAMITLGYVVTLLSPSTAGAIGVLAVFLLSYTVLVVVLTFLFYFIHKVIVRLLYSDRVQHQSDSLSLRRAYYYSSILALGPVVLVSFRSVGNVGIGEVGLIGALLVIGCLYVSRQTR